VIEAFQFGDEKPLDWFDEACESGVARVYINEDGDMCAEIETLEGTHRANMEDYIIRGVKGELYPCKPDVFAMTYEAYNGGDSEAEKQIRTIGEDLRSRFLDKRDSLNKMVWVLLGSAAYEATNKEADQLVFDAYKAGAMALCVIDNALRKKSNGGNA